MRERLSGLRWVPKLALVPLSLVAVSLALVAPSVASASASSASASPTAIHRVSLKTLVGGLSVRTAPSLRAKVTSHLGRKGSKIIVDCWARGSSVAGNPIWYHVAQPRHGYVTAHFVNSHKDPYPGLVKCGTSATTFTFKTKVAGLYVRSGPSTTKKSVGRLGKVGSTVVLTCWVKGQNIRGDVIWYYTIKPFVGYVAGRYLNTGSDPAKGVPHC
jgi:hypothetical protein